MTGPVGLIVTVTRIVNGHTVLLVLCPFCGDAEAHRVSLEGPAGLVAASCRGGEFTLKVHRELAAGRRWEPGDPDADDEDEREPRWVD